MFPLTHLFPEASLDVVAAPPDAHLGRAEKKEHWRRAITGFGIRFNSTYGHSFFIASTTKTHDRISQFENVLF